MNTSEMTMQEFEAEVFRTIDQRHVAGQSNTARALAEEMGVPLKALSLRLTRCVARGDLVRTPGHERGPILRTARQAWAEANAHRLLEFASSAAFDSPEALALIAEMQEATNGEA